MQNQEWSRRDTLRLLACGASAAALPPFSEGALAASADRLTLEQCLALSPLDMAKSSRIVGAAYQFLQKSATEIGNAPLAQAVGDILRHPAPSILTRLGSEADQEEARRQLVAAKLLAPEVTRDQLFPPVKSANAPAQPFLSAPGSGYNSHHAYPGGLCLHVALNVRSSLGLYAGYRETFGFDLDRDVVLAAQLLHDLHKPWVFQWKEDGGLLPEYQVAGTGAHHILSLAESLHRGLPAEVVVAQAAAHDHPGSSADEAKTVGYLKAAALIAGKDPVAAGLLAPTGETVPLPRRIEGFVTHIGDHDWVIAGPANQWTLVLLQEIAQQDYGMSATDLTSSRFNRLRNYVFSQISILGLHQMHCIAGRQAVRAAVNALVVPI